MIMLLLAIVLLATASSHLTGPIGAAGLEEEYDYR